MEKLFMVLISTFLAAVAGSQLPAAEPTQPGGWTPELAMQVKRIGSVQVSPDGKQTAFTVRTSVMEDDKSEYLTHIYLSTTEGTAAAQLTQGDKSCDDPQWSPDGAWIAFVTGRVGKKNLWLIRPAGGEAQQLTACRADITSFRWAPDGRSIAFTATDAPSAEEERRERGRDDARVVDDNFKYQRLFVTAVPAPPMLQTETKCLAMGNFHVVSDGRPGRAAFDWSPDGKSIVYTRTQTTSQDNWPSADLSVVEIATGESRPLVWNGAAATSPLYSPDGQQIVYLASDTPATWAGKKSIHVIAAAGGTSRPLADTWDAGGRYTELVGWSADGSQIYFTEAHGTNLQLLALPLQGQPVEISRDAGMSLGGVCLNLRRTHFGFGWETLDRAPEAFVSPVERFAPVAVSHVQGELPQLACGPTEVIRWKSKDGLEIEGLLTYPVDYDKSKRYPFLLVIHGGPMGVFTQQFDGGAGTYPVAVFSSNGYAVLRANVRGSSGYGQQFRYANYNDWGGGDYHDLMTGVDHVIALGVADPQRMGVMGWSYGGYMTSWIITQTNRFRAASVGAGVTNLISFTGTADIPSFLPDYFAGEFWDKPNVYQQHSPMFHIGRVSTPTLVQHGERDERVPLSQGQELYNALKRQHCITKMVIYPRTPHGIEEPKLLLDCMHRNLEWFEKHAKQLPIKASHKSP